MEHQPQTGNPFELLTNLLRGEGQEDLAKFMAKSDGWWSHVDPITHENNYQRADEICSGLVLRAAKMGQTCYMVSLQRALSGAVEELIGDLSHQKHGLHLLVRSVSRREGSANRYRRMSYEHGEASTERPTLLFIRGNDSVVMVSFSNRKDSVIINLHAASLDNNLIEQVRKIYELHTEEARDEPELNIVSDSHGDLDLVPIGRPAAKLIEDNYTPQVVEEFKHVVAQFTSRNPMGRLAILHGEPGTGKTYLLRAFMAECNAKDTNVIFFPPQIFEGVNSPQITRLLLDYASSQSMVLFIEDGDGLLLQRGVDNMNILASLLSLSDGFLGSLLDIRVFVTTNTRKLDIDKALLRECRLNRIIEVGKLSAEQGARVFQRLSDKEWVPNESVTLAQVYKKASEVNDEGRQD